MNQSGATARRLSLAWQFAVRDVEQRYRGSVFGLMWSFAVPLLMLSVFTFVFTTIFQVRWPSSQAEPMAPALFIFAGMITFGMFAEVMNRAPTLVTVQPNLVKKVVFPVEILPVVAISSALFQAAVSWFILAVFQVLAGMTLQATALLAPLVVVPLLLVAVGLAWFVAALGVYFRDLGQIVPPLVTAAMFISPIFYPSSHLPEWVRPLMAANPVAFSVEAVRDVLFLGRLPDPGPWAAWLVAGTAVAGLGYAFFQKVRKGFADVL